MTHNLKLICEEREFLFYLSHASVIGSKAPQGNGINSNTCQTLDFTEALPPLPRFITCLGAPWNIHRKSQFPHRDTCCLPRRKTLWCPCPFKNVASCTLFHCQASVNHVSNKSSYNSYCMFFSFSQCSKLKKSCDDLSYQQLTSSSNIQAEVIYLRNRDLV